MKASREDVERQVTAALPGHRFRLYPLQPGLIRIEVVATPTREMTEALLAVAAAHGITFDLFELTIKNVDRPKDDLTSSPDCQQ